MERGDAGKAIDRGLRYSVGERGPFRKRCDEGGNVHNGTGNLFFDEDACDVLDEIKASPKVHVFRLLDFLGIEIEDSLAMPRDARIVEQRVDPTIFFDDRLDDFSTLFKIGYVEFVCGDVETLLFKRFGFPVEFLFLDIRCGNGPTFLEKFFDRGETDSLGSARDNNDFSFAHDKSPNAEFLR